MRATRLLVVCSLLLTGAAHAQIYKCKDERGQLLLSDKPCASGELLQRKSTAEERAQDNMRAYEANVNKQNRRAREQAKEMGSAQYQQRSLQSAGASSGADSAECKTAQRDLEFASSSIARNEAEKRSNVNAAIAKVNAACGSNTELMQPPPRRPAPPVIVSCQMGGCNDNYGKFYSRSGPNLLVGPNGETCNSDGSNWYCN